MARQSARVLGPEHPESETNMASKQHHQRTGTWLAAAMVACALGCTAGGLPLPGSSSSAPAECPGTKVTNEGWTHVSEGSSVTYGHSPPASGNHYPVWAEYKVYDRRVPRPYWVHNVEHGAVVLLFSPDAPADVTDALREAYNRVPLDPACGTTTRVLLAQDPELPAGVNVAMVAADHVTTAERLTTQEVLDFVQACRGHGPEDVCGSGAYREQ